MARGLAEAAGHEKCVGLPYPPLEGEGRLTLSGAKREPGWGEGVSASAPPELRDHPTPLRMALRSMRNDPPPPGEGESRHHGRGDCDGKGGGGNGRGGSRQAPAVRPAISQ
ncbi:hypothetical protein BraRD5C2_42390 [Bradyrhizobium sp. RD5-C2]|nr:hypothetical protein BraRD5C2_42390 [Bradyrhizobium sp. RD5-C2]